MNKNTQPTYDDLCPFKYLWRIGALAALPLGTYGLSPCSFPLFLLPELGGLPFGLSLGPFPSLLFFSDRDGLLPGYAGAGPSSDPGLEGGRVPLPFCVPGHGVVDAVPVTLGELDGLLVAVTAAVLEGVLEAVPDAVTEGVLEPVFEGVLDGVFEAVFVAVTAAVLEGVLEAVFDAVTE